MKQGKALTGVVMRAVSSPMLNVVEFPRGGACGSTLSMVEEEFVDNWARLGVAFGMSEQTARVHAVLFLSEDALTAVQVAAQTGLSVPQCHAEMERLHDCGVAYTVGHTPVAYEAEKDPWVFFAAVVRYRAAREFAPILSAIRSLHGVASEAHARGRLSELRMQRISTFSQFIDHTAKMFEAFAGGASSRPVMSAARMVARFLT